MPFVGRQAGRAVILLSLCLVAACSKQSGGSPAVVAAREAASTPFPTPPGGRAPKVPDYAQVAATLSGTIDAAERLVKQHPENGLIAVDTVGLYLERAWLSGNYDDYRLAQQLLDAVARREVKAPIGCLAQARLHYAVHRLAAASNTLAACAGTLDPLESAGMSADIAFYSGRYQDAEANYRALVNQVGTVSQYIRLAMYRKKTGAPGEASALLEAAEKRYHGDSAATRAWLKVQRGLVAWERGRLDEALALYQLAAQDLPGWWLIDEQIAEVRRLQGDATGARLLYESIIARTGQPEHMDELARLLREGKNPGEATAWIDRAQALYRERLRVFPEAGLGHAVDHFLQFGTPDESLALARRHAQQRPFGDAQITLAAALFRAGQAGEAAAVIERVEQSGWVTAQLHAVAAQINAGLGRRAQADAQRSRAIAINPHAMRLYTVAPPVQPEIVSML